MNSRTMIVLGGLLFAGTALAGDPASQNNSAPGASLKVAIDKATGKQRALTAEESAALDAQATNMAMGRSAARMAQPTRHFPATMEEAEAGKVEKNGIVAMKPTADMVGALTVTRNADGTLVYSEDGVPLQAPAQREVASE